MMREFKPGVYTHYKEGTKYHAYEDTTDEATQLPRISYFALDKPEKRWNREVDIFMAPADPDPEINKTGQEWKFEFLSNEVPIYTKPNVSIFFIEDVKRASAYIHIGDQVKAVMPHGIQYSGELEQISYSGFIVNDKHLGLPATILWRNIQNLYKVYGG